jgi:GTP-binding protein LepA
VSRSLSACEGSLLVVDASQGVEAQTLANVYQAIDNNHEIVTVLNKIDLPAAEPDRIREQIEEVIGIDASQAVLISAKTGLGIPDVLEAIVHAVARAEERGRRDRAAEGAARRPWYDTYLGVIVLVRILDGVLKKGQTIRMMGTDAKYQVERVGVITPKMVTVEALGPGEIGFITASIKEVADTRVGDTITEDKRPTATMLPGFKPGAAGGVLRPVPGRRRRLRGPARRHGQAAPQRQRPSPSRWNRPPRSASASAAVSSGCCTSKSSRSASSANSIST